MAPIWTKGPMNVQRMSLSSTGILYNRETFHLSIFIKKPYDTQVTLAIQAIFRKRNILSLKVIS